MAKKIFEVEYDDDLHFADAKDDSGSKRGLLYDDEGNLKTHAKMREVDEEELYDRYGANDYSCDYASRDFEHSYCEYDEEEEEERKRQQEENIELLAAFIVDLIVCASPHVKKWWQGTAAPKFKGLIDNIAYKVKNIKNGKTKAEVILEEQPSLVLPETTTEIASIDFMQPFDESYDNYRENMTSEEAQRALVDLFICTAMQAKLISKLNRANIIADDGTVTRLTSDDVIASLNSILNEGALSLSDTQYQSLRLLLNRDLFSQGEFIPIDGEELRKKLLPSDEEDGGEKDIR